MGNLVAEHGDGRCESAGDGQGEGGTNCQAVRQVVHRIADNNHPRHWLDICKRCENTVTVQIVTL